MGSSRSVDADHVHNLILFDGVCNLCSGAVQFIVKKDKAAKFKFASLQSPVAGNYLRKHNLEQKGTYSIIFIHNGKAFDKSNAVLEIAKRLSGAWPLFYAFKILPKFIRDFFYYAIARNRYRWFGKKDECMIPTAELKARFLES